MLILVMMLHEHAIATNFESLFFALTVTGIVTKIVTNRKKERKKDRRWVLIIIKFSKIVEKGMGGTNYSTLITTNE